MTVTVTVVVSVAAEYGGATVAARREKERGELYEMASLEKLESW